MNKKKKYDFRIEFCWMADSEYKSLALLTGIFFYSSKFDVEKIIRIEIGLLLVNLVFEFDNQKRQEDYE